MKHYDLQKLLGLPLDAAREVLEEENILYEITSYEAPRGALGDDRRVLRAVYCGEKVQLVTAGFLTEIHGEKIGNDCQH